MRTSEFVMELVSLIDKRDEHLAAARALDKKINKLRREFKKGQKSKGVSKSERAGTGDPGSTGPVE